MSKIVELKLEEIDNVVGGIMAAALTVSAATSVNVRSIPHGGTTANVPPPTGAQSSNPKLPARLI